MPRSVLHLHFLVVTRAAFDLKLVVHAPLEGYVGGSEIGPEHRLSPTPEQRIVTLECRSVTLIHEIQPPTAPVSPSTISARYLPFGETPSALRCSSPRQQIIPTISTKQAVSEAKDLKSLFIFR